MNTTYTLEQAEEIAKITQFELIKASTLLLYENCFKLSEDTEFSNEDFKNLVSLQKELTAQLEPHVVDKFSMEVIKETNISKTIQSTFNLLWSLLRSEVLITELNFSLSKLRELYQLQQLLINKLN